jgi:hypothetical protein
MALKSEDTPVMLECGASTAIRTRCVALKYVALFLHNLADVLSTATGQHEATAWPHVNHEVFTILFKQIEHVKRGFRVLQCHAKDRQPLHHCKYS